jgi:hypothetical protein
MVDMIRRDGAVCVRSIMHRATGKTGTMAMSQSIRSIFTALVFGAGQGIMLKKTLFLVLCGAALLTGMPSDRVNASTCRDESRNTTLSKGNDVKLSTYSCRGERDNQAQVRVQVQRLSGSAPGALLNGGASPWTSPLYGKHRILINDVLKEYKYLFEHFGSAVEEKNDGDISMQLTVTMPGKDDLQEVTLGDNLKIRSFILTPLPDIPLVDETLHILNKQTWPDSMNMFYQESLEKGRNPLDSMTVWRYLTLVDFNDYYSRLNLYNSKVRSGDYKKGVTPEGKRATTKAIGLLEYLTKSGWPEFFLYAKATLQRDEPCVFLDFTVNQYSLAVDIAVIENFSSKALQIDQLIGRSVGSDQLREMGRSSAPIQESSLWAEAIMLAPSERLIVPLAISFLSKKGEDESDSDARKIFRRVAATKPGTVFQTEIYSKLRGIPVKKELYSVRKMRDSFKPPAYPTQLDYSFGPEWALTGLTIGGEQISFGAPPANLVDIRRSDVGSCPILYAWSGSEAIWLRHGKILHQAGTRTDEETETVSFEGFVHRFRIAEEELERATVSGVKLIIEIKNGNIPNTAARKWLYCRCKGR